MGCASIGCGCLRIKTPESEEPQALNCRSALLAICSRRFEEPAVRTALTVATR